MPNFHPGTGHRVRVTVRNSGTAPAAIPDGLGLISIIPDVGDVALALPAVLNPGAQFTAESFFTIPTGALPGSVNAYVLDINYDGKLLHATGPAFTVEALGPFYAIDTWEQIAPDTKYRYEDVACGWHTGPVRVDAHFLFGAIPTDINQATLRFFLRGGFGPQPFKTELRDPYYGLLGTENNSPPATITLDVTAVVKARGTLWVVINPAFWLGVVQFKYFGGVWDGDPARIYWPRVEVS